MIVGHPCYEQPRIAARRETGPRENLARVLPYEVFLDHCTFPRSTLFRKDNLFNAMRFALRQQAGAVTAHLLHQFVDDTVDGDHFFFVGADDVVVKRRAGDDVLACQFEVGGIVDDDGWVAGAGTDRSLAARHRLAHDAAATGHDEQAYALMDHKRLRGLDRRLCHGADQVVRATRTGNRAVQQADVRHRTFARIGVHVEHDAVTGRQHGDRVADDRRGRVRRRRNGADHAIGGIFGERQPSVPGNGLRRQDFGAGCLEGRQPVLDHLVFDATEPGLTMCMAREFLGVFQHRLPDRGDDLLAPFE